MHDDTLAGWEKWPLAALFLANALNVFILYVPTADMPLSIIWMLPWVRVACGIAAAASLEGTLIAVTMGRRLGRDSYWSWAAMFAASAFTAMVAYYVHAEVGLAAAGLFMAQAVVLFIYTQHLAQPRKVLTPEQITVRTRSQSAILAKTRAVLPDRASVKTTDGFHCSICDHVSLSLADANKHNRQVHKTPVVNIAASQDLD